MNEDLQKVENYILDYKIVELIAIVNKLPNF
jgi:hypothetical protein